ncbi:MAG: zinc ribbon domain-containing protein [Clostridia bacterium]|nr:zinc ribbon domain-containing protein [Clostridia bacterium]
MTLFENLTKRVTETARAAAKKSSDIVEVTKLTMAINTEEDKIEKAYAEIGKIVYLKFAEGEAVADEVKGFCEDIKLFEQNIEEIKQKILDLRKVKVCPECTAELEPEMAFCHKCGAKQVIPEPPVEEPSADEAQAAGKVCTSCNSANQAAALYCSQCGTKLDEKAEEVTEERTEE